MISLKDVPAAMLKWEMSDDLPKRERPIVERATAHATAEYPVLCSALAAIPNAGGAELDYEDWRNIIFAIHSATDGDDTGLALAHSFSERSSKYDPDFLDTRVWPYITERDGGITVQSLFNRASAHGWLDPAIQSAFEVLPPDQLTATTPATEAQRPGGNRFNIISIDEFTSAPSLPWIVKGVIPQAGLAVVFGESTAGKTFFVLDVVGAVARGVDWRGKKTAQGACIYICAESVSGFRNRVRAYCTYHDASGMPLGIIADAPNFMEADDIRDIIRVVKRYGPVAMVVVDTLARTIIGADENSAQDMGKAIYHCEQLHRVTGALVMLVHHSGKDASKGARGSGALRAAADCEIEISRADNDRSATVTKLKDGEDGTAFNFRLKVVDIGLDDDMEMVTSCVVEAADSTGQPARLRKPQAAQQHVIGIATSLLDAGELPTIKRVEDLAIADLTGRLPVGMRNRARTDVPKSIASLFTSGWFLASDDRQTFTVSGHVPIA